MRIVDVSAYTLSSSIEPPQERRFLGGVRRLSKRDVILVVVETADGKRGFATGGASSSAMREYFEDASHSDFADLLEGAVAAQVVGEAIEDAETLAALVERAGLPPFLESKALAPLDVAFYDLLGKERGVPVYELLADGTEATTHLPLYASAGMYMSPEGYAEQARAIDARGFGGYKYRPGLGVEADVRTLQLVRKAVGDGMDVMVDAHTWWKLGEHSYTFEEVVDLVNELAAYDPYWVEEPVPPTEYEAYRRLADATNVALAGGESEETPDGLVALAETDAVRFLQGDVRHHRGFTGCLEAVERCADTEVTFVPHNFGTHLGLVANAHLAAVSGTESLEYPVFGDDTAAMYPFPLAEDILVGSLDIADGHLSVPDGPGLGVEVNLEVIEEYPYIEGPWTEFDYAESN